MIRSAGDVAVTAYSLATPLGNDREEFKRNLFAGRSGISSTRARGTGLPLNFPVPYAGFVQCDAAVEPVFSPLEEVLHARSIGIISTLANQAARDLPSVAVDAVVYANNHDISSAAVSQLLEGALTKKRFSHLWAESSLLLFLKHLDEKRNIRVKNPKNVICLNTTCTSGQSALAMACQEIARGRWESALVVGYESANTMGKMMFFHMLDALAVRDVAPEKACRPFAKDRSGLVMSEGGAVLLVENVDSAKRHRRPVLGVVKSFAQTSDAYRLTDGREDCESSSAAISLAIQRSGVRIRDVDYINAHGTATPLNDLLETRAIKKALGERAYDIPVSSTKSQLGHIRNSCALVEIIACLHMLDEQKIAPTINYDEPDPECDLDYVPNVARDAKLGHILKLSFGFGGHNAAMLLMNKDLL